MHNTLPSRSRPRLCVTLMIVAGCCTATHALPLFSNGSASPTVPALNAVSATRSGISAPGGALYSESQSIGPTESNMIAGLSAHTMEVSGAFRFADNFTVPAAGWRIDGVSFYAYQPGAVGPASPFAAVNVRIWSGQPGAQGSAVIYGDAATNRLANTTATNVYRIFNTLVQPFPSAPDSTRQLWKLDASLNRYLAAGTYWIDFQIEPSDSALPAYVPTLTVANVRTSAGANALQFRSSTQNRFGAWESILDAGKPASAADLPQDLPFLLTGSIGCPPDFNQDGEIDFFDYLDFLDAFSALSATADFNSDGVVDFFDYLDFIDAFAAGC